MMKFFTIYRISFSYAVFFDGKSRFTAWGMDWFPSNPLNNVNQVDIYRHTMSNSKG